MTITLADDQGRRGESSTSAVERTYDRVAPLYDLMDSVYERSWKSRLRSELFSDAGDRILDVGIGTGCNIPHYPAGASVVGIDSSRAMLARARKRADAMGRPLELHRMNLLELAFPDDAFDTVVATFVLLCLTEAALPAALAELRRVCRRDGQILVLDYRMSERATTRLFMRIASPWLRFAFAARYDAGTERHLCGAGLTLVERRTFMGDGVGLLRLRPTDAAAMAAA